jgi:hypothetical protein
VAVSVSARTAEDEKLIKMVMLIDDLLKENGHGLKF